MGGNLLQQVLKGAFGFLACTQLHLEKAIHEFHMDYHRTSVVGNKMSNFHQQPYVLLHGKQNLIIFADNEGLGQTATVIRLRMNTV